MSGAIGIDFGTTNTVVALARGGEPRLVDLDGDGSGAPFRTALSFHRPDNDPDGPIIEAGTRAIGAYLADPRGTRFIQSFKSYAASPAFSHTHILGKRHGFEDLLSTFLLKSRRYAGDELATLPKTAIVGRPVTFAGASPDSALALARYEVAFRRLGLEDIRYAFEPVAAAFFFARELSHDATVLVADFGGGTSDFSVVRFERSAGRLASIPLSNAGVGLAGNAFDFRIIDNLVSPELGKGSSYKTFGKLLPIPSRYFTAFGRWEQLALLHASKDMPDIRRLVRMAEEPEKLALLVELLDDNHGYRLYQAVSRLKEALSGDEVAEFSFEAGSISIREQVTRARFESWISPELVAMELALDEALNRARLGADEVDRVFLTGGTSFVPAVRRLFERRFGARKVGSGGELVSIASGLALMGESEDLDAWTERAPPPIAA